MEALWNVLDAVGSFGGMILAGIAGYVAYRLFKVESRRDEIAQQFHSDQAQERAREQAAHIGFWWDDEMSGLVVHNASALPIYEVGLFSAISYEDKLLNVESFKGAVRPGANWIPKTPDTAFMESRLIVLRFTDCSGLAWFRDLAGTLVTIGRLAVAGSDRLIEIARYTAWIEGRQIISESSTDS
ncbi:hypothetical protein ACFQO7_26495 [Catellatospora aurea]|uniref:Uncharacterized protein n=1 Tax=Catellatospora aurea TaxID=1337874 RepID=A0ABW2H1Q6_9ACTN